MYNYRSFWLRKIVSIVHINIDGKANTNLFWLISHWASSRPKIEKVADVQKNFLSQTVLLKKNRKFVPKF